MHHQILAILLFFSELQVGFSQVPFPPLIVTRQSNGDFITLQSANYECSENFCIGLTSGTGTLEKNDSKGCTCQCLQHLPVFREDLNICVDDIQETVLAPFVGGSTSQLIPFVFLPLKGQLIYPSKEISLNGLQTPVCAVSKAKFLTTRGWMDLKNPLNGDVPFRLYRDEGRSFLQWDGEADFRLKLSGRLVLVHLKCREATDIKNVDAKILTPSVAFRVVGTPLNNPYPYNVSEVVFVSSPQASQEDSDNLSISEYVAIGICSILLGLIYVASVFLYLHIRKRNRSKPDLTSSKVNKDNLEEGVIKNNPLLGLSSHFQDSEGTLSESELHSEIAQEEFSNVTSAIVHQNLNKFKSNNNHHHHQQQQQQHQYHLEFQENSIERLPEENVSIIETMEGREEKMDDFRMISGTVRKKLYFNPAYFEPHLLMTPPPAAIEFLQKIREVISIAKQKIETKRFVPTLLGIPEEDYGISVNAYNFTSPISRSGSVISLKRENSRRKNCTGCPGCTTNNIPTLPDIPVLTPCTSCTHDVKQRNIRKWLENLPTNETKSNSSVKKLRSSFDGPPSLPPTRDEVSRIKSRRRSPTRSLSPDFGRRSMSPPETVRLPKRKLKKPKNPPPLPPTKSKSVENIYDTVSDESKNRKVNGIRKFDYEADSLERTTFSSSKRSPNSTYSPSPSSTSALPMDEEMTMRNDIFNIKTGNRTISKMKGANSSDSENEYELIVLKKGEKQHGFYKLPELLQRKNSCYSLVSEVYVNNGYDYNSSQSDSSNSSTMEKRRLKVSYTTENQPGKLLIEVEDCLDNYIPVNDSDSFEPDTLDRKPTNKKNGCNEVNSGTQNFRKPDQILLRTNGSFRKDNLNNNNNTFNRNFGSLREIYEAKTKVLRSVENGMSDEEKLLTLEERHNRRQRRKLQAPDVIPPPPAVSVSIYDQPKHPPRKIEPSSKKPPIPPKNGKNRSANFTKTAPSPFGIPENKSGVIDVNNSQFGNSQNPQSKQQQNANLKNLQSIIDKELKKNWVENLNNKNRNLDKIVNNTEEMLVISQKSTNIKRAWQKLILGANDNGDHQVQVPLGKPEDSGYLSTDSNDSRTITSQNDRGSETDESLGDGQSESGGESVETHSVFFGRFSRLKSDYLTVSTDSGVDESDQKSKETTFALVDDSFVHSSDSEHASYATVVPLESYSR